MPGDPKSAKLDLRHLLAVAENTPPVNVVEAVAEEPHADVVSYIAAASHALAYILIASRRHTDVYKWAQRDVEFSLAAEVQRRLLPSAYTVEGGRFTLAGWLEPASDVGGDTFDYSFDREYLYLSITDAMGHGVESALLATLVVGRLRNTRAGGGDTGATGPMTRTGPRRRLCCPATGSSWSPTAPTRI